MTHIQTSPRLTVDEQSGCKCVVGTHPIQNRCRRMVNADSLVILGLPRRLRTRCSLRPTSVSDLGNMVRAIVSPSGGTRSKLVKEQKQIAPGKVIELEERQTVGEDLVTLKEKQTCSNPNEKADTPTP